MVYLLLAAGGSGSRMNSPLPKQFLDIGGKPLFIRTLSAFSFFCSHIAVGMNREFISLAQELLCSFALNNNISIIEGGKTRMETMQYTYNFLNSKVNFSEDDIILTHDAARPFVTEEIILNNIAAASNYGACGTFLSVTDTIALSKNGETLESVPNRRELYNIQTPQTFKNSVLKPLMEKPLMEIDRFTDMCGLAKNFDTEVHIVNGSPLNIKITTETDLLLANAISKKENVK